MSSDRFRLIRDSDLDQPRLRPSIYRVLCAMSDGRWRSLAELTDLVGGDERRNGRRLRELRRPENGRHRVQSRRRGATWEYRLAEASEQRGDAA